MSGADLGFSHVVAALGARTRTPYGLDRSAALRADLDGDAVRAQLAAIDELRGVLRRGLEPPREVTGDLRAAVRRLDKGAVLSPEELLGCAVLLRTAARLRRFGDEVRAEAPSLASESRRLTDASHLAARIESTFEPNGSLRDDASVELSHQRGRARALHQELRGKIDVLLRDVDFADRLQDTYFSVRGDRYVLPIKASFKSAVPGIVHNASQTGQTLFIEPEELVPYGNELAITQSLIEEEERRVMAELSGDLGANLEVLTRAIEVIGRVDFWWAATRLAEDLDAATPTRVEAEAPLVLRGLRHPLLVLAGKKVVASDVELVAGKALAISGPNAGGKTVAMTAVGLAALMVRAGLPIPAAPGSSMPLFGGVGAVIDDAQSLAEGLSTFTAHLSALQRLLERAAPGWLCLVDEICGGTDPKEGGALAAALLDAMLDRGARVIVTSHLEEVKALGMTDPRYANARVGHDAEGQPTYSLELGPPGVSHALDIAARANIPAAVVERARGLLKKGGALSAALAELEGARLAASEEAATLRRQQARLDDEAKAQAERLAEERRRARDRLEEERQAWATELEASRKRIDGLLRELEGAGKADKRALRQSRDRIADEQRVVLGAPQRGPAALDRASLEPGKRVHIISLGQDGEVVTVEGDMALVAVGSLRSRVSVRGLAEPRGKPKKAESRRAVAAPLVAAAHELDVRGMRADDALRALEGFLDQRYLDSSGELVIRHGHGTGALKKLIRDTLRDSPYVTTSRAGEAHEGGDGVTVLRLRDE